MNAPEPRLRALLTIALLTLMSLMALSGPAVADPVAGRNQRVGLSAGPRMGRRIPLADLFVDAKGNTVSLRSAAGGKPSILALVYYGCPNLCTWTLNGLVDALRKIPAKLGRDYRVITVSIDPREKPSLAMARKRTYLARYGISSVFDPRGAAGWDFLTGSREAIARLTEAVGFRYRYDPSSHEFVHPAGILVLTPGGEITRYFPGIHVDPKSLERSLKLASRGGHLSTATRLSMICSRYRPGRLASSILAWVRDAWIITAAMLAIALGWLAVKERRA